MRMRCIVSLLLAAALTLAYAQPSSLHADENSVATAEIKALELKLAELTVHADWDEYAKNLASDYIHVPETGPPENKDEAMSGLRDVKRKIILREMEPEDLAIYIYGDTAVCSATFTITLRGSGQVKTRLTRETDIFVKRNGQWWLVAGQNTAPGK
jgi:ketosteroid isomerase-like protein